MILNTQYNLTYLSYEPEHFDDVIELGNLVHGDNYADPDTALRWYNNSFAAGVNASLVAYDGDQIVGFRITFAPGQWVVDKWCTPELWGYDVDKVCYFKCNTVAENYRGKGIGKQLLSLSKQRVKAQGGVAGVAHIWLQSPGNSAFRYMTSAGGTVIKHHPGRWLSSCLDEGYYCVVCQGTCSCEAAEMILDINPPNKTK